MLIRRAAALLVLSIATFSSGEVVKTWDKPLAPGMTFRMEVEANPSRTIYGIKFDPKKVRAESWLAGGSIYEPGSTNGRAVVSQMVREAGAQAGFNGDFFQWTPDPGGDPQGFMMQKGSLISAQGKGQRSAAWVWGPKMAGRMIRPKAEINILSGLGLLQVTTFNGKLAEGGIGLSFDISGEVYGTGPLTLVHLDLKGAKPVLNGEVEAVVLRSEVGVTRGPIQKGTAVISAEGEAAAKLTSLAVGDRVKLQLLVSGLDEGETEAVGGGPLLLRRGAYAGPAEDDKAVRNPRTLVGTTPDGHVWSVVVDGRQTMSVGTTHSESAEILKRWGCTEAINLDGGGSSTLHSFGVTLNRPSGGVERSVANGVVLFSPLPDGAGLEELAIEAPASLKVGDSALVKVTHKGVGLDSDLVVWTCQGAGWIDQDGVLKGATPGAAAITCLVQGHILKVTVVIEAP